MSQYVLPHRLETEVRAPRDEQAPLDTTHTVSNPRVELDGDRASLLFGAAAA